MLRTLLCLLAACGTPAPAVATPAPSVALDAAVDAGVDATVAATGDAFVEPLHIGAVPVPGEYEDKARTIRAFDTTVDAKDLPAPAATWRARKTLRYRGEVAIALHISGHERLALSVVDTVTETPSGYPGTLDTIDLGPIDGDNERPGENDAFSPRDVKLETGDYVGPVMFAIRVLPRTKAPEAERRQYVVYTNKKSIFVAEKLVTDTVWTPRLRLDAPHAKKLAAINPGWH